MPPKLTGRAASLQRNKERRAKLPPKKTTQKLPTTSGNLNPAREGGARGLGFEDAETQETIATKDREALEAGGSITAGRDLNYSVGGGGPTVMSNANKIERVVPLLNSKANSLSSFNLSSDGSGGANFTGIDDKGGTGGDDLESSFAEVLNFTDKKNKKKDEEIVYSPMEQQQLALLEQMRKTQDKRLQQSMSETRRVFDERRQQQEDATQQSLNVVKQALNLGGSSRYAPVSSQGIISATEQAGIKALAELDSAEQKTIAQIKEARDNLDYQTLEKKFEFLDGIRKEKAAATTALEETVKAQEERSSRDNALASLVSQGITNPVEMLNMLNFDEAGNQIGDFTLSEITGSLKSLNELSGGIGGTGFKLENKAIGQLLGGGWTGQEIRDMQLDLAEGFSIDDVLANVDETKQAALKKAFGIEGNTNLNITPGKGAQTPLDEALVRTRLFAKIAPILNKGALSDDDRAIIDSRIAEFRDGGMGEQEILDTLAGIPPEVASPYNSKFRDIIVSNSETMEKQGSAIGRLSQQLASGNYTSAMNTVETLALNEAKKLDPDGFIGTATTQNYLKKGQELSKLVSDAESIIGPLDGTWEQVKGKLGKSKNNKAAEISAKIAALVAQMRNDLSGTAVTSSEAAFLEPLIPSLSDRMNNFNTKIKALNENTLGQYNTVRSSVSLPEVSIEQVIDPKKRLILYSNDIYLPTNGQLDI